MQFICETNSLNAVNLRVVLAGFGVVSGGAEYHHSDSEEKEEHAKLSHAGLDGEAEYAQAVRMLRQLENAEHSQHSREQERAASLFFAARTRTRRQQVRRLHLVAIHIVYNIHGLKSKTNIKK